MSRSQQKKTLKSRIKLYRELAELHREQAKALDYLAVLYKLKGVPK